MPQWFGPVARSEQVTVKGRDRAGKAVRLKLEGLLARAIQHEVDHLDGTLFTDRVEDRAQLRYVDPTEDIGPQPPGCRCGRRGWSRARRRAGSASGRLVGTTLAVPLRCGGTIGGADDATAREPC